MSDDTAAFNYLIETLKKCCESEVLIWSTQQFFSQCFKRFQTAKRALEGIEAVNIMSKGQVKKLVGNVAQGQAKFVASLFQIAA